MKLACSSSALHAAIERGDLTQPEFLDLCAGELQCDGIVLDTRHFPRTDRDYLAQVKKTAADRGLTVAALWAPEFFEASNDAMQTAFEIANAVAAPLIGASLAAQTARTWSEQLERLGAATSLAKTANVTLALRNASGSFASGTPDCKRVAKEADSAWLRFGPEPAGLPPFDDAADLAPNSVLLWEDLRRPNSPDRLLASFAKFRGHLALDSASGDATAAMLSEALGRWRAALCAPSSNILNRT